MDIRALIEQLQTLFSKLTRAQKAVILGSIVAVIAFIVFLVMYNAKNTSEYDGYKLLFDNLDPKDAALIVQQLQADKIPYKLPDESTVLIPTDMVYNERIKMASMGLPKSSNVGYELFDQQQFGATDFEQRIKYLRALEGELAKTIESLQPIEKAEVNIALPKESVFVSREVPPSASVVLTLASGQILSQSQIFGIRNLVAASIPKLEAENVKIINSNGEPLGENDELASSKERAQAQIRYKQNMEKMYEDKIIHILSPIVGGVDNVVAKVTMDFDFDQKESEKEVYDPNNVVRSEQVLEEKREGYKPKEIGGVPGAVSNIGPVQGLDDGNLQDKYQKSQTTTNYEITKTTSKIKGEFATLKRISAAVVVDGKHTVAEDGTVSYVELAEDQIAKIDSLVRQAIGFAEDRGDEVTVTNFMFDKPGMYDKKSPVESVMSQFEQYVGPLSPLLKILVVAIVLFVFYKKVIVPFAQKMTEVPIGEDEDIDSLMGSEEDEEDDINRFNEMKKKVEEQLGIRGDFSEDEVKYEVLLEKMRNIVSEKPEEIAGLFSALVRDELGDSSMSSFDRAAKEHL